MSQHGRRRAGPPPAPVQRYAGLSVETALVLLLVLVIAAGSVVVHAIAPAERGPQNVVGDDRVRVTTVGKGGVLPGPVKPRVVPVVVPTEDPATEILIPPKKIKKAKKPKVEATPSPAPTPEPTSAPILTPPGGDDDGGNDDGRDCTLGILCTNDPGGNEQTTPPPADSPDPAESPDAGDGGVPAGEETDRQTGEESGGKKGGNQAGAQPPAPADTAGPTDPR